MIARKYRGERRLRGERELCIWKDLEDSRQARKCDEETRFHDRNADLSFKRGADKKAFNGGWTLTLHD